MVRISSVRPGLASPSDSTEITSSPAWRYGSRRRTRLAPPQRRQRRARRPVPPGPSSSTSGRASMMTST